MVLIIYIAIPILIFIITIFENIILYVKSGSILYNLNSIIFNLSNYINYFNRIFLVALGPSLGFLLDNEINLNSALCVAFISIISMTLGNFFFFIFTKSFRQFSYYLIERFLVYNKVDFLRQNVELDEYSILEIRKINKIDFLAATINQVSFFLVFILAAKFNTYRSTIIQFSSILNFVASIYILHEIETKISIQNEMKLNNKIYHIADKFILTKTVAGLILVLSWLTFI